MGKNNAGIAVLHVAKSNCRDGTIIWGRSRGGKYQSYLACVATALIPYSTPSVRVQIDQMPNGYG
jgi:hypothetical protein